MSSSCYFSLCNGVFVCPPSPRTASRRSLPSNLTGARFPGYGYTTTTNSFCFLFSSKPGSPCVHGSSSSTISMRGADLRLGRELQCRANRSGGRGYKMDRPASSSVLIPLFGPTSTSYILASPTVSTLSLSTPPSLIAPTSTPLANTLALIHQHTLGEIGTCCTPSTFNFIAIMCDFTKMNYACGMYAPSRIS